MADLFISYAREDRETAHALAEALEAGGHAVWWDRQLAGGSDFTSEIERELMLARVVLVLWSQASVQSGFVRDECTRARDAGKLLPLRIESDLPLPLGFGSLHTLDLIDWDGDSDEPAYAAVRSAVRARLVSGPQPLAQAQAPRGGALRWRRWRWPAAGLAGAALAGGLWFTLAPDRDEEAQAHLQAGLAAHFAREPNLEVARNAYLAALRARPDMAVAHYYLGLAYGELKLRPAALTQFAAALAHAEELDEGQRSEAARQRDLLSAAEPAPLEVRVAAADPAPPTAPSTAPAPAPGPTAAPRPPPLIAKRAPAPETSAVAPEPEPAAAVAAAPTRSIAIVPVAQAPLSEADDAKLALIRVAPSEAQRRRAQQQVDALLGADNPARAAAAAALALDETLAADALPALLERTLAALAAGAGSDAARQALGASLRLLQSASPAVLRKNQREVRRLIDAGRARGGPSAAAAQDVAARLARSAQPDARPFVFVQIADERQRPLARLLAARLAAQGYSAPGIEDVGAARAPAVTQVRLQGASDPALGRWMAQHVSKLVQAEVPLQILRSAKPATDTYEVWLDKALCVSRVIAECNPG